MGRFVGMLHIDEIAGKSEFAPPGGLCRLHFDRTNWTSLIPPPGAIDASLPT